MFVELPQQLIVLIGGAFLLGWILSAISSAITAKFRARKRDPRDDRIRELEAVLRIAESNNAGSKTDLEKIQDELKETAVGLERRDNVISEQQAKIDQLALDLKESVIKTRELRSELAERATENVHAEAKIREVETELSVAQASTDMIATGILDYSLSPDGTKPDTENDDDAPKKASRAAT